ncbi:MAG: homocysteine S-methyltransferase [Planctomycetota bacterium]
MEPQILDGGLATELEARGIQLNTDLWSAHLLMDQPEIIAAVHRDYLEAGADLVTAASYQATIEGFIKTGLTKVDAENLIQKSVQIAKEACERFEASLENQTSQRRLMVAASVGPYGAYLANGAEFTGEYDLDEAGLYDFHQARWHLLADTQPDIMLCETVPSFIEATALGRLASESSIPVWISFSCRDGRHINDGTPIRDCAALIEQNPQVAAIGINCTAPKYISDLVREIRSVTEKPIAVYPNSGETFDPAIRGWRGDADIQGFAEQALDWRRLGADIIGGCCRTTPEHIRALRTSLNQT